MSSTQNWWGAEVDWSAPAGQLLKQFAASLPTDRPFHFTVYGSAPLQLTVDRTLLSADVDIFSDDDEDIGPLIRAHGLDSGHGGLYLEGGFELSFRTSPRWRTRASAIRLNNVTLTFPHPIDILIGKLDRLAPKDLEAFRRVIECTGHPTESELKAELQNAVDLFRPGFNEEGPNRYQQNTEELWRTVFGKSINVQKEI
ncbi:MAG: hypothetical protein JWO95_1979, partial [Verrucomicrobiales bacterium]|nr:hypothetical protein [Verrucomicrobiales bacterium]